MMTAKYAALAAVLALPIATANAQVGWYTSGPGGTAPGQYYMTPQIVVPPPPSWDMPRMPFHQDGYLAPSAPIIYHSPYPPVDYAPKVINCYNLGIC